MPARTDEPQKNPGTRKRKTVLTYGTFDLTHLGHVHLLRRAKERGDYLIVGLSTDAFNRKKNKESAFPYAHRKEILESIRSVDLVIPERSWKQKERDIRAYDVDVLVMGDDWKGRFDSLKGHCEVIYLPRTKGVSTTQVKEKVRSLDMPKKETARKRKAS